MRSKELQKQSADVGINLLVCIITAMHRIWGREEPVNYSVPQFAALVDTHFSQG